MSKNRKHKFNKPHCYRQNKEVYPLCIGAEHQVDFAENDCCRCRLYENYIGDDVISRGEINYNMDSQKRKELELMYAYLQGCIHSSTKIDDVMEHVENISNIQESYLMRTIVHMDSLESMNSKCFYCGKETRGNYKYCGHCGRKFKHK